MADTSLATFDKLMKEVYQRDVQVQINRRTRTLDLWSQKSEIPWSGREIVYPVEVSGIENAMALGEFGTLPDPGTPIWVDKRIPMKHLYTRVRFSKQVMTYSRTSKGAFERAMEAIMGRAVRDLAHKRNLFCLLDGRARLATATGAMSGTTLTVDAPGGVAGTTNPTRYLQPNMVIAIVKDNDGDGVADSLTGIRSISSVADDGTNNTVVLNSTLASVADSDWVTLASGTSGSDLIRDTSANQAPMGLLGIVDDTTYLTTFHNINRSTYPVWNSHVFSSVGALSLDILQRGFDIADMRGEAELYCLLTHHSVRRAYLVLLEADRRYSGEYLMKPDLGTKGAALSSDITYAGVPFKVDKDAPYGIIFGLGDKSSMLRWSHISGEWADEDGRVLRIASNSQDAWEAFYRIFENYDCDRPNASVRWDGVTANVVTTHLF
ncbi:MAG: phage major capsid protein [Dehalococcoidia bacterium]